MLLYRLAKTARATDLTGEGAKRAGGRWNYPGTPVVYSAQTGSLAVLEVLQYVDVTDIRKFSMLTIDVPDEAHMQRVSLARLPDNWQNFPYPNETKEIGRLWLEKGESLLLEVPSAVYPDESNWLINPLHSMADQVRIVSVKPFVFSDRLFR
ncbi:MAG: RES domain-containing protein [Cytophagales bacterium]|nr:MAG: RES domain-containing protein [Cytophagales bacterium]